MRFSVKNVRIMLNKKDLIKKMLIFSFDFVVKKTFFNIQTLEAHSVMKANIYRNQDKIDIRDSKQSGGGYLKAKIQSSSTFKMRPVILA